MRNAKNRTKGSRLLTLLLTASILFGTIWNTQIAQAATGKYYIKINKGTNVVTVYEQDGTPYTAFTCSIGYATPIGTFYTPAKYRWWTLDGPCYGQYCTRITGSILFHSVWYHQQTKNSQSYIQYNKLGTTASHGCCRLTVAASKWIYDNCPLRTKVIIFNGSAKDDPLGKPKTIKIDTKTKGTRGWDPTDPDESNPYKTKSTKPVISVSKKTISRSSKFGDGNMTCKDSGGFDITDWVQMTGKVNTKKPGTYPVTYSVIDSFGRTATKNVTYKVVDDTIATLTGVKTELTKSYKSTRDMLVGLRAKNADGKNLTNRIAVYVKVPGSKEYTKIKKRNYTFQSAGVYRVKYKVTNPVNGKTTTKSQKINVIDKKSPKLTSADKWSAFDDLQLDSSLKWSDLMEGVGAALQSGKDMTNTVKITIQTPDGKEKTIKKNQTYTFRQAGDYTLTYEVMNSNAPKSKRVVTHTRKLTVLEEQQPDDSENETGNEEPGDGTENGETTNETKPADGAQASDTEAAVNE